MSEKIIIHLSMGIVKEVFSSSDIKVEIVDDDDFLGGDSPNEKRLSALMDETVKMRKIYDRTKDEIWSPGIKKIKAKRRKPMSEEKTTPQFPSDEGIKRAVSNIAAAAAIVDNAMYNLSIAMGEFCEQYSKAMSEATADFIKNCNISVIKNK